MNIKELLSSLLPVKQLEATQQALVVTQNDKTAKKVSNLLRQLRIDATVARDGEEALALIKVTNFLVVFVDLNLDPDITELVAQLKAAAPVIVYGSQTGFKLMRAMTKGAIFCYANGTVKFQELKTALSQATQTMPGHKTLVEAARQTAVESAKLCRSLEHTVGQQYTL